MTPTTIRVLSDTPFVEFVPQEECHFRYWYLCYSDLALLTRVVDTTRHEIRTTQSRHFFPMAGSISRSRKNFVLGYESLHMKYLKRERKQRKKIKRGEAGEDDKKVKIQICFKPTTTI